MCSHTYLELKPFMTGFNAQTWGFILFVVLLAFLQIFKTNLIYKKTYSYGENFLRVIKSVKPVTWLPGGFH